MKIRSIQRTEVREYAAKLHEWAEQTIELPKEAFAYNQSTWSMETIEGNLDSFLHLAAWEKDAISGLILGTPPEGGVGTVIWLLVDTDAQRRGIGSGLLETTCQEYRRMGAHKIKLTVPSQDTVKFYEKQGMEVEGVHRNHWWNLDFWAMGKIL